MIYHNTISLLGIYKAKHGTLWCYTCSDKILTNVCLKQIPKILCVSSPEKYEIEFLLWSS